jgi:transcriptional antiterminator RfaH
MHWYALSTKPRQEDLADINLQRLGVETFYPQLREDRLVRRKRQTMVGPLFPGYLFARFDAERQYRAVNFAQGVRRLLTFGSEFATVDEAVIASIRARLEDGYVTIRPAPLSPGQRVRISDGPFGGLEAVFERQMTGSERVVVLLRTLAHQARVVLPRAQVVPA